MARIHARTKGKSRSKRPVKLDLSFVTLKSKEIEKIIVDLVKKDNIRPSEVGLILRDTYGVPSVKAITGKSITKILEDSSLALSIPEDLEFLVKKATDLKKHLEHNPKDLHNKRGLLLINSKIRRLVKYYKKKDKIPQGWSYN